MKSIRFPALSLVFVILLIAFNAAANAGTATLKVDASKRAAHPIPKFITGKFAEHLGNNIYIRHGSSRPIQSRSCRMESGS